MISSFGDSGLPVFHAGQTFWHRPHSVHVERSRFCFQVRSLSEAAPRTGISSEVSSASMSIFSGRRVPRGLVFVKNTSIALVTMWRCFEYRM